MESQEQYLKRFPELTVEWTKEQVALITGKRKEDSWLAQGGFKVTHVGCTLVETNLGKKLDMTTMVLIHIGFQNLLGHAPTIDEIASKFFKGDFNAALPIVTSLFTGLAVRFIPSK
jgi:hypothetical protein